MPSFHNEVSQYLPCDESELTPIKFKETMQPMKLEITEQLIRYKTIHSDVNGTPEYTPIMSPVRTFYGGLKPKLSETPRVQTPFKMKIGVRNQLSKIIEAAKIKDDHL